MRRLKQTFPWEIKNAVIEITLFRGFVVAYFNGCTYDRVFGERTEKPAAVNARREINLKMTSVQRLADLSQVNSRLAWTPPPAVGGYARNIDLIANVFLLGSYQIRSETVIDVLDQAIGTFQDELRRAWIRLFNPLFWIELMSVWVAGLPFRLLGFAGFDAGRAEASILGRMVKFLIELTTFAAALTTIMQAVGVLELLLKMFK